LFGATFGADSITPRLWRCIAVSTGLALILAAAPVFAQPPAADAPATEADTAAPPVAAEDIVKLDCGSIRGQVVDVGGVAIRMYAGIPYAAPPVGPLRWRPPQPVTPWSDVRDCTTFAPACPQPSEMQYGFAFQRQAEDCLYLNVWTGAASATERRPVMVWIHGGGNASGGTEAPVYSGRNFAAEGVVVVTIQYRLGVLGYFAHPALTAEAAQLDGFAASGNYGLMDQIAALRWVQANIGQFGGDKDRVTIFGESAGATNVTLLMACPLSAGLFHRAIAQSGYYGESMTTLKPDPLRPQAIYGHQLGAMFAQRAGAAPDFAGSATAEALRKLREMPAEALLAVTVTDAAPATTEPASGGGSGAGAREQPFRFGPMVDGHVIIDSPSRLWASGAIHKVPLIAGSLLDDGTIYSRRNPVRRLVGYHGLMNQMFGDASDEAKKLFPVTTDADIPMAMHRMLTLMAFRAPARRLVTYAQTAGAPAWLYHFSQSPARSSGKGNAKGNSLVAHGLDVPYVFGTFAFRPNETDAALSAAMRRRWINFAHSGDPNIGADGQPNAEPYWPNYDRQTDQHLEFGPTIAVGVQLDRDALDFIDRELQRREGLQPSR
jgi:para-nitrobenzyl esterase